MPWVFPPPVKRLTFAFTSMPALKGRGLKCHFYCRFKLETLINYKETHNKSFGQKGRPPSQTNYYYNAMYLVAGAIVDRKTMRQHMQVPLVVLSKCLHFSSFIYGIL